MMIGRTVTPGVFMSISRKEMPSCALASGLVRTRQKDPVTPMSERRPGLLAVDNVVVALAHCPSAQGREIGAGTRLGVALAPRHLGAADAGQEAFFLLVGSEGVDHGPDHLGAKRDDARRALLRQHVLEQEALRHVPARAAVLPGPGGREPALAAERALALDVV